MHFYKKLSKYLKSKKDIFISTGTSYGVVISACTFYGCNKLNSIAPISFRNSGAAGCPSAFEGCSSLSGTLTYTDAVNTVSSCTNVLKGTSITKIICGPNGQSTHEGEISKAFLATK